LLKRKYLLLKRFSPHIIDWGGGGGAGNTPFKPVWKVIFQFLIPKMMPQYTEGRNPVSAGVGFILRFKIAQFNVYV